MTTLTSPHDLLSAVPFLVGYHPTNSLVVIALVDQTIGLAMRIDFPTDCDADQIDALANHLAQENADGALIVAYLPHEIDSAEFLLTPLQEAISLRGVVIRECLVVHKERWRSIICADQSCCPPEGSAMPDIESSRISAEQVAAGKPMPFAGEKELFESLSATEVDTQLIAELRKVLAIAYASDNVVELQRQGALAVNDLVAEFAEKGIVKDKKLLALVLVRLHDVQVRDYAMGITSEENAETLQSLWRWLMRTAPAGYVAPVATLFAASSYELGDGAMAHRALHRALDDDSRYPLAKLLRRVFSAGWPPAQFTEMRAELHPKVCALLFPHDTPEQAS